jgi:predicted PurR-regulated permease PerM
VFEYAQKFIGGVFFGIGRLFLVLMVAAFILIDLDRIQGFLRSLVPERYQVDYDRSTSASTAGCRASFAASSSSA